MPSRFTRNLPRVGDSWKPIEIDQKAVAGYRFEPYRFARLRSTLDVLAVLYIITAAVAIFRARILASTPHVAFKSLAQAARLWNFSPRHGALLSTIVFLLLVSGLLLHESRWIKQKIYFEVFHKTYDGLVKRAKPELPVWKRAWIAISSSANYLVLLIILCVLISYLDDLRPASGTQNPLLLSALTFAGILLAVIGASDAMEALDPGENEDRMSIRIAVAVGGAILCAAAFASIVGLGMHQGRRGAARGFAFGFALAISARILQYFIVEPRHLRMPRNIQNLFQPVVKRPLMALGRIIDWPLKKFLVAFSKHEAPPPRTLFESTSTFQPVSTDGRFTSGYEYRPPPVVTKLNFFDRQRAKYVQRLLPGDTWITAWLKREPVRMRMRNLWDLEDPLDAKGRVRHMGGEQLPFSYVDELYRRLLSLMLAAAAVAWLIDLIVGHFVAAAGKPLLEKSAAFALLFGLAVGAVFALNTLFGRKSMSALTIGLVSGLALDPTLSLGKGIAFRLAHNLPEFVVGLIVLIVGSALGKRALGIFGAIALTAGIYLQSLASFAP